MQQAAGKFLCISRHARVAKFQLQKPYSCSCAWLRRPGVIS